MTKFILRYIGIITAGFCIGFGRPFEPFVFVLCIVTTLSITISNIVYYEIGKNDENL